MTDDGDAAGDDMPDDGDAVRDATPDDSDATGDDTPDDGDAVGDATPDDSDATGDDTPDDGDANDTPVDVDPDRLVGYSVVYAGVLFLLMGVRTGPRTLGLATVYFLATGVLFVGGGLYRLVNPVEGGSIPDSYADQITIALTLALALLTGVFLLSLL
jgi:hypothetical protein